MEIACGISSVIGWAKEKNLETFVMSPDFQYVRHEVRDLEITIARRGEVTWAYCI